ncbi:hypothetical protein ACIBI3_02245 [Actinomadura luteofluorescens]|uniref:hypothetical protein n=1 Tax=Actinomadura luteofluorescens TaxID=46163 RepID=UPI003483C353
MTTIKLDSKVGGDASTALEPHIPTLYSRPGVRVMAVLELAHVERTQPAPGSDKEPSVKMQITSLELPSKEQEHVIRDVLRALYLQRTAAGTLEEDGQISLTKSTLNLATGHLHATETARLRAGLSHWERYARRVADTTKDLAASEFRHEMRALADGLTAILSRAAVDQLELDEDGA